MKPLLLIVAALWFIPPVKAQTPKYSIANGEYANFILDNTTQTLYGSGNGAIGIGTNSGFIGLPIPCQFPHPNTKIKFVAAGLHTASCIDVNGNVYFTGANEDGSMGNGTTTGGSSSFVQVTTDNLGNSFTNVTYLRMASAIFNGGAGYGAIIYAIKADGTLWVWGNTQGGYLGNGTYGKVVTRPMQVSFPAGTVITKVIVQNIAMALDANGNVWTWAGNGSPALLGNSSQNDYETPHTISLPSKAIDIAGGGFFSYALLSNHSLYGWGWYTGYMGVGGSPGSGVVGMNPPSIPMLLDTSLNLPKPISILSTNGTSTYVILSDGSLWAWGGNECGQIGNGQQINWKAYTIDPAPYGGAIPEPYNWNQDASTAQLQQHKPIQIAPGLNNFVGLSEGVAAVFYKCAVDANGQLYSWGRNKNGVLANGVIEGEYVDGLLGSNYPNSFDVPYITAINPFSATTNILSTSPECISNPGARYCNLYRIPTNTPPVSQINGTRNGSSNLSNVSTVSLDGTGSTDNVAIVYYVWSQVSGPNNPIISIPSGKKVNVLGLRTGTYVFQLKTIDNGWMSDSTKYTLNITDSGTNSPVANAGANQTITLPTNSVTLTGSGSETGGTIISYQWTQLSGPSTAVILPANLAQTSVKGLIQGVYTFQLQVTDAVGVTAKATVTVTVKPVPPGPPSANAGADQTITLPTNSVTLTGSGSEANGEIVSYLWTQLSGPGTASITNSNHAQTSVTALVQGIYTFQLTVTDSLGIKATGVTKVTVNAAVTPGRPSANAGPDQTITLPTNTVTLTGTGSETNGTIVSYLWTQLSGPSPSNITSPNQAQTTVTGLVQGSYTFQLTVTDNSGIRANDIAVVTVKPSIVVGPPVANAGPDQTITLPTNTVALTGSGSETNGTIVSYLWTQLSGPSTAKINTADQAQTTVSALIAGVYEFQLTVTDNSGVKATDVAKVTVDAAIVVGPPVANAGPDQTITLPTNTVTLTGSGSETNGTIASYLWTQLSGPSTATINTANQAQTTVSALVAGVYLFQLTVTDNSGVKATDVAKVTVNPTVVVPGAPVVNAGSDQTITLPVSSVSLTATASETNGLITTYLWTELSGPSTAAISTPGQATTSVNGLQEGKYTFQITVTDSLGITANDVVIITVKAALGHGAPVVNAGSNQSITLPTSSVNLSATASESNGLITTYLWSELSGPSSASISTPDQAASLVTGLQQGVYTFQITVTDSFGVQSSDVVKVTVNTGLVPGPPQVNTGPDQSITLPVNTVTLTSTAWETDGTIVSYQWIQLSGPSIASIATPTQTQTTVSALVAGYYTFQVIVTDNSGVVATSAVKITVNAAAAAGSPEANAGSNQTITLPTDSVVLSGSGSEVNGTIVSYQWTQISGPSVAVIGSPSQPQTSASGLIAGNYLFQLTVTDSSGATAYGVVIITVNAAPVQGLPSANAGSDQILILPVNNTTLTGSGSETNGTILSYQWTQLNGPSTATISPDNQAQTSISNLIQGLYIFELTVTDSTGQTASNVVTISVNPENNLPPVANAGPNQTVNMTDSSILVVLNGTASYSPNGPIEGYQWVQVSGAGGVTIANSSNSVASLYGLQPGIYTFQLTVTDNQGDTASAFVTITVNLVNSNLPVAIAGNDTTISYPASEITLNGSASYDLGGTITSYHWTQLSGPSNASLANTDDSVTSASQLVVGEYVFELTVADSNGDSSESLIHVSVISTLRSEEFIQVYPNPFLGNTININGSINGQGRIGVSLYDINGKRVLNSTYEKQTTLFQQNIMVPNLAKGCYILELQFQGKTSPYSFKLIKQ